MVYILKKEATPLRVRAVEAPLQSFPMSGVGIDISACRTGHIGCGHCSNPFFFLKCDKENRKVTVGCSKCHAEMTIVFPLGTDWSGAISGQPNCPLHKGKAFAIIKCDETVCIGCQHCKYEFKIELPLGTPLIV